jgi:hypothetical protein
VGVKFRLFPFALAVLCCNSPKRPPFAWPKNPEDVRASLLIYIPEGRDIAGARAWMAEHGFDCDAPMASATNAHAHVCHAAKSAPADAGWSRWTVVLYERRGRLADAEAR